MVHGIMRLEIENLNCSLTGVDVYVRGGLVSGDRNTLSNRTQVYRPTPRDPIIYTVGPKL